MGDAISSMMLKEDSSNSSATTTVERDDKSSNSSSSSSSSNSSTITTPNTTTTTTSTIEQEPKFYFRRIKFSLPGLENAAVIQITELDYLSNSNEKKVPNDDNDLENQKQQQQYKGIIENPIDLNTLNADTTKVFIDSTSDIINFFGERNTGLPHVSDPGTGIQWYIATVTHLKWYDELRKRDVKKTAEIIPYLERQAIREKYGVTIEDSVKDRLSARIDDVSTSSSSISSSIINGDKKKEEDDDVVPGVYDGEYFLRTLEMYQFIRLLNTPLLLEQLEQLRITQNKLASDTNCLFGQLDERIKKFHGVESTQNVETPDEEDDNRDTGIPYIYYPPLYIHTGYEYIPFDANAYNSQDMVPVNDVYPMEQHHNHHQQQQQYELSEIKTESIQNPESDKLVDVTVLDKEKEKEKQNQAPQQQKQHQRDTSFDNQTSLPHNSPLSTIPANIQKKQYKLRTIFNKNPEKKKVTLGKKE